MTEEPKIRLFSIIIHAWRAHNGNSEVNIQSVIVLLAGDVDIAQVANDHARQVYPTNEDWKDQQAFWIDIPQDSRLGPFRLRWHADVVDDNASAGAGAES